MAEIIKLFVGNEEGVSENGNIARVVEIEDIEFDAGYGNYKVTISAGSKTSEFRIGKNKLVSGKWVENAEGIKEADELCNKLFGCDFDKLIEHEKYINISSDKDDDLDNSFLGLPIELFYNEELNQYYHYDRKPMAPRKDYAKLSKIFRGEKEFKLNGVLEDTAYITVELQIPEGEYGKKFAVGQYRKRTRTFVLDRTHRTYINAMGKLLETFGTTRPTKLGGTIACTSDSSETVRNPFIILGRASDYETELAQYWEFHEKHENEKGQIPHAKIIEYVDTILGENRFTDGE